jgi:hypothetical protein
MFEIQIALTEIEFKGLEALDRARAWGLGDRTYLVLGSPFQAGRFEPVAEVDEAFARSHFRNDQRKGHVAVPPELLKKGDVRMALEENNEAVTFADIPAERIEELFLATRAWQKDQPGIDHARVSIERLSGTLGEPETFVQHPELLRAWAWNLNQLADLFERNPGLSDKLLEEFDEVY